MDANFFINSPEVRDNCLSFLREVPTQPAYIVDIKQAKRKRGINQNALYWTWLGIISNESGFTTEDLHNYFKVDVLGCKTLKHKGREVPIPKSTRDLSSAEFAEYMDEIQARAYQNGITLPYKNFFGY